MYKYFNRRRAVRFRGGLLRGRAVRGVAPTGGAAVGSRGLRQQPVAVQTEGNVAVEAEGVPGGQGQLLQVPANFSRGFC